MSVLARDIDAYKRAVEQYNRQLRGHNKNIDQYNQTIVTDANGNAIVRDPNGNVYTVDRDGHLNGTNLAPGKTVADYGATEAGNGYSLLRQNPQQVRTEQMAGVQGRPTDEGGGMTYFMPSGEGGGAALGPEWRYVSQQGASSEGGSPTYTFERDASVYMDRPGEFEGKLRARKPDPSMAQVRRMFASSPAQQERGGLLTDAIRGNGLATGGTPVQYRSGSVIRDPNTPTQPGGSTPIDPALDPRNPRNPDNPYVVQP